MNEQKNRNLTPEEIEHLRASVQDAKFRARLWEIVARWAKTGAAIVLTTHATVVVFDRGWEGVKRWLSSLVR